MSDPSSRVVAVYDAHGRGWDADRQGELRPDGFPFEHQWLERLTSLLPTASSILDLGCGGGIPITRYLTERNFRVTGVDASSTMIELWRSRFPDNRAVQADMRQLELGERFSGLIAWDSFFHLPQHDQRSMFRTFARHAAPHAALLFTSGGALDEAVGSLRGEPLYHASLDPGEYESLLVENGFVVRDHVTDDPQCHRTVWLAQRATGIA
ncbi:MAG: class I SAM-dependent methyltransferase [Steroidobacteraceae bacterium]